MNKSKKQVAANKATNIITVINMGNKDNSDSINIKDYIIDSDENNINNNSYKINAHKLIEPQTGKIISLDKPYKLSPSKIILFQTREKINLPYNIYASYSALYSVSSVGILLLNAGTIDSNYNGPLSGILLNFSAKDFIIKKDTAIARIILHKSDVNINVNKEKQTEIADKSYTNRLRRKAQNKYHQSFMNIHDIEQKIMRNVFKKVKGKIVLTGISVSIIIAIATIEPFLSRWLFEKTGVITTTKLIEVESLIDNIEKQNELLQQKQHEIDSLITVIHNENARN